MRGRMYVGDVCGMCVGMCRGEGVGEMGKKWRQREERTDGERGVNEMINDKPCAIVRKKKRF